ncbi:hypothetical protein D3C75_1077770 [compost metagenome]
MVLHLHLVIGLLQLEEIQKRLFGLLIRPAVGKALLVPVAFLVNPYPVIIMVAHVGIIWRKLVLGQYRTELLIVLIRARFRHITGKNNAIRGGMVLLRNFIQGFLQMLRRVSHP